MSKYVMEQRSEKAKEIVGIMEEKRLNDIQLNFIQRKMGELGRGSGRMEREAIIVVDREDGKGGKVRLNYLVGSVTWRPEYKLRAGKVNEDVQVDYLANLMQHSGEDWNQVKHDAVHRPADAQRLAAGTVHAASRSWCIAALPAARRCPAAAASPRRSPIAYSDHGPGKEGRRTAFAGWPGKTPARQRHQQVRKGERQAAQRSRRHRAKPRADAARDEVVAGQARNKKRPSIRPAPTAPASPIICPAS